MRIFYSAVVAGAIAAPALAQESTNVRAATLPGVGRVQLKQAIMVESFDPGRGGATVTDTTLSTSVVFGVARETAVLAHIPLRVRDADAPGANDSTSGLGDIHVGVRRRFIRRDLGPLSTLRVAFDARLELPTGTDEFTSGSIDPDFSVNLNYIRDLHGFNASLGYKLTTGSDDATLRAGDSLADRINLHTAYVFRINPESFDEHSTGSTYLEAELLTYAETNGDTEAFFAPGLLYEGQRFAAEVSLRLPVLSDTSDRPSSRPGAFVGVRFLF